MRVTVVLTKDEADRLVRSATRDRRPARLQAAHLLALALADEASTNTTPRAGLATSAA